MRIGTMLALLVFLGTLTGCSKFSDVRVESAPAMPVQIQPTALERVVKLATMTPTYDPDLGTPTPYVEQIGNRPTPTPFSLRDWGAPVTTYSDRTAGFVFEGPSDWVISPPSKIDNVEHPYYVIAMCSSSPIVSRIKQDEPPRMAFLDILVSNDGIEYTLEEAVKLRKEEFQEMDIPWIVTAESEWTLPSGIPVVRFELDTPIGPAREIVAVINGRWVLFTGTESLELFDSIAMSLQQE